MAKVINDVVSMDWEADGFIESKVAGFICAIHKYVNKNGKPIYVTFMEGNAFAFIDDQGSLEISDIAPLVKKSFKIYKSGPKAGMRENVYDLSEWEEYTLLVSNGDDVSEKNVKLLGLSNNDVVDMKNRIVDLSGYYNRVYMD